MEATNEMEMMKDGARRVQAFLEERGVAVKHNVMLEALSAGFGSRNWRTVRDKLSGPAKVETPAPAPVVVEADKRWHVYGHYVDNRQSIDGYYPGSCAQEAQAFAQVERRFDEDGSEIRASFARDRQSADDDTYNCDLDEYVCSSVSGSLKAVLQLARMRLGEPPQRGIEAADDWDAKNVILEVCEEVLEAKYFCRGLNDLDKWTRDEQGFDGNATFDYTDSRGVDYEGLTGKQVLETLCGLLDDRFLNGLKGEITTENYAFRSLLGHDEVWTDIYHVRAILKYASAEVNWLFHEHFA